MVTARPELDPLLEGVEHYSILPPLFSGRMTTLRTLLKAPELRRILNSCDLVHCIVEPYAPLAALAKPRRMPFVLSVFGTWAIRPLESRAQRLIFAPAFKRTDRVLSISGFTRDWMERLIDLPHVEVLPGGVHPERFMSPADAASLPNWVGKEPVVFSVGAVKPRKGQHIALEAVALARQRIPNLHYAMAGSLQVAPAFVERLRKRAAELGIQDYVHFLGLLPPYGVLTAWYQNADVYTLRREPPEHRQLAHWIVALWRPLSTGRPACWCLRTIRRQPPKRWSGFCAMTICAVAWDAPRASTRIASPGINW
jgi:glycosyltransferase involved in cell wall biosynthesis